MSRFNPKKGYGNNVFTKDVNSEVISPRTCEIESKRQTGTTSHRGSIREMEVSLIKSSPVISLERSFNEMKNKIISPVLSVKGIKRDSLRDSPARSQREIYNIIEKQSGRVSVTLSNKEIEIKSLRSLPKESIEKETRRLSATTTRTGSTLQEAYHKYEKESYFKTATPQNSHRLTTVEPLKELLRENPYLEELSSRDLMNRTSIHKVKIVSPPLSRHHTSEGKLIRKLSRESSIIDITRTKVAQNRIQLSLLCFGLILTTMLAGADETIVSTVLGSITNEFRQAGNLTWVAGSYLLTSTAMQPLYGKFSDIFGRGIVMSAALGFFAVGSVGCGSASSLTTLVIFRGVSGMGAGGLESLSYIIIADATPIEQRSLYMSLINVTFSIANIFGPLVGGLFVDYFSWRWAFFINIPIGAIAVVIMVFLLPIPRIMGGLRAKLARIDFLGTATLVIGIVLLVLAINWGGVDYPWQSVPVIACLVMGFIVLSCFVVIEWKFAAEPIIPFHIFKPNVIYASLATVCSGVVLSSFVYYWPMYHQIIHSSNALNSGLQALPVLLGDSFFAALSGLISHRTKTYRWMMRSGMFIMFFGAISLALKQGQYSKAEEILYPLIIGIGLGLNTQTALVASQAAVLEDDLAIVTALTTFSLSIGGVFGLAIVGAVFDNVLHSSLRKAFPAPFDIASIIDNHDKIKLLPPAAIDSYLVAYRALFTALIPPIAIGLLATFIMQHIPLVSNAPTKRLPAPTIARHSRSSVIPAESDSIIRSSTEKHTLN